MNTPLLERLRMAALDGNKLCSEAAAELEYALIQLQSAKNGEGAALDEIERLRTLYRAVNLMMAALGYHGTISARDDRVSAVMDALHEIDEGRPKC